MSITLADIKKLRDETSAPIVAVKEALNEASGDYDEAKKILHKRGQKVVDKKSSRESKEGMLGSYVHSNGKIGVLVKVNCETDFVARNEEFKEFVHEVALQIAAVNPEYVNAEDVPDSAVEEEVANITEEFKKEGKPEDVIEKIVSGKVNKIKDDLSLMNQPLVKNPDKTLKELLTETTARLGEKIEIGEFVRYEL